jgi:hypothetical protein
MVTDVKGCHYHGDDPFRPSYAGLTRVSMLNLGTSELYGESAYAEQQHGLPGQVFSPGT